MYDGVLGSYLVFNFCQEVRFWELVLLDRE